MITMFMDNEDETHKDSSTIDESGDSLMITEDENDGGPIRTTILKSHFIWGGSFLNAWIVSAPFTMEEENISPICMTTRRGFCSGTNPAKSPPSAGCVQFGRAMVVGNLHRSHPLSPLDCWYRLVSPAAQENERRHPRRHHGSGETGAMPQGACCYQPPTDQRTHLSIWEIQQSNPSWRSPKVLCSSGQ